MLELLAGAALRSLLLAAAVSTGLRLRRSDNPQVSLAAWTLVLAASLLMPVAMRLTSIVLPSGMIPVGIMPVAINPGGIGPGGHLPLALEALAWPEASSVALRAEPDAPANPQDAPLAAHPMHWGELASLLYLAVFSGLLLRLLSGLLLSWRIVRGATPICEYWAGGFDVRASSRIDAPATFGSVILLPGGHAAWTPARRLAVLAHEGAHVARRDFAIQLAAGVNRAVFWFNPFSWWLHRRLSDLAEAASDDAAIACLDDRFGYAEILLDIAGRNSKLPGAIAMARRAAVAWRIERILSETPPPLGMSRRDRAMLAGGIVPIAVLLSLLIILPAPSARKLVSAEAPSATKIVADQAAAEGVTQPAPREPGSIAAAVGLPPSASREAIVAPTEPAVPSLAHRQPEAVASLSPPPLRSQAAARGAPQRVGHTRSTRQPNRNQGGLGHLPGPEAVSSVTASAYPAHGPDATAGADGQSPLFNRVVDETCMGTYSGLVGGAHPVRVLYLPVRAHFYRGADNGPWVTFNFAAQQIDLPVAVGESKIEFTSTYGTIYTLLPSGGGLLPPRYHRLTGSAEHPSGGTIDVACKKANHPL